MNNPEDISKGMTPNLPLWSYQLQQNSKFAVKTRKDLEVHLITRALKDEGFKQELLANPKAVVEKELGTKFPEGIEINVLEETEDSLYMVLPSNPYEGLTESELKASLGLTLEDVAQWVLEQQRNALLDDTTSVQVITRAWRDQAFKHELLCNPEAVIEKELGAGISASINIRILEETAHTFYLVLPKLLDNLEYLQDFSRPRMDAAMGTSALLLEVGSGGDTNDGTMTCDGAPGWCQ